MLDFNKVRQNSFYTLFVSLTPEAMAVLEKYLRQLEFRVSFVRERDG